MPNPESPYGGRIFARGDGSVLYQISARVFQEDRNVDGTLEYAIRKAGSIGTILPSLDSKCFVQSREDNPNAKFLIVSGYEAPEPGQDARLVGKAYYITADAPRTGLTNKERMQTLPDVPKYDLTLRYDDYDIERVRLSGMELPFGVEPDQLSLCYQHWSVAYFDEPNNTLVFDPQPEPAGFTDAKLALITERQMQRKAAGLDFEHAGQLLEEIKTLRQGPAGQLTVAWASRWRRVQLRSAPGDAIGTPADPGPVVADEDEPITAKKIVATPGSRTITAIGIDSPGTFVLMCHGECWNPPPTGSHDH